MTNAANIASGSSFTFSFGNLLNLTTGMRESKVVQWTAASTMGGPAATDSIAVTLSNALTPYGATILRGAPASSSLVVTLPNPVNLPYIDVNLSNPNGVLWGANRAGATNQLLDKYIASCEALIVEGNTQIRAAESLIAELEQRPTTGGSSGGGSVVVASAESSSNAVLAALSGIVVGQMISRGRQPLSEDDD